MKPYSVFVQIWLPNTPEVRQTATSERFSDFLQDTIESSIEGYLNVPNGQVSVSRVVPVAA